MDCAYSSESYLVIILLIVMGITLIIGWINLFFWKKIVLSKISVIFAFIIIGLIDLLIRITQVNKAIMISYQDYIFYIIGILIILSMFFYKKFDRLYFWINIFMLLVFVWQFVKFFNGIFWETLQEGDKYLDC